MDVITTNETINALTAIFEKHINDRICVIGTMCCGKTTLVRKLYRYNCVDADDELWHQIPVDKTEALSLRPITKRVMDEVYDLMHEKVTVKPGFPLFGITILDCEVVVYLDISPQLLERHCDMRRDTDYIDALYVKKYIEEHSAIHEARGEKTFYYLTVAE